MFVQGACVSRSGMLRRYGILVYVPSRDRLLGVFAVLLVELLVSRRFLHSKLIISKPECSAAL